jgi:hypothetical protein
MMLGKLVKRAGFRQLVGDGSDFISVRWVSGWRGVIDSLQKNAFRGLNYSFLYLLFATAMLLAFNLLPFVAAFFGSGAALGVLVMLFLVYVAGLKAGKWGLLGFALHPLTTLFFLGVLWRSALTALRDGGVYWRGTFYPLKELKRAKI